MQITSSLKKNYLRSGERHVIETPDGKQSITKFKRLKSNQKVCSENFKYRNEGGEG